MPSPRLNLALERLTSSDWRAFELFAAEFLAVEFPSLRTMASAQGDKGRDGQLYSPTEEPSVAVQYSVTTSWNGKIAQTVTRLADTMPQVRELIYATNQVIGPAADDLVAQLRRQKGLALDIRDRSWFVERELTDPQRAVASEELAKTFVDPLLAERGLRTEVGIGLSKVESRVALLHLTLEARDEATDKGLTKSTFETLVLAALHDTDSEHRITEEEVVARVAHMVPSGHEDQVGALTRGALGRLSARRGRVKRHNATSDYCLSYAETLSLRASTTAFLNQEEELESELVRALEATGELKDVDADARRAIGRDLRGAIETVLLRRGEHFASTAVTGVMALLDATELLATVAAAGRSPATRLPDEAVGFAVVEVLGNPSPSIQSHLRRLADAYTVMAFLRETPDVQKVVLKIFSEGSIWIDTSVVLPLIAERLLDDVIARHYTLMLRAAVDAGLHLYITEGVAEEVERHLNRSLIYARGSYGGVWHGESPFVYKAYSLSGRPRGAFADWLETVRGNSRPVDDVCEYLRATFAIETRGLLEHSESAPVDLRGAVQELWQEAHDRRKSRRAADPDPFTADRLAAHDVENSVGVIMLRKNSQAALGFHEWWLTLDRTAYRLGSFLRERLGPDAPKSPVLSPDFLIQLLRLGPLRAAVNRDVRAELPLLTEISRMDLAPNDLIERAEGLRKEHGDLEERLVRRRVRDTLDLMRAKRGPEALLTVRDIEGRVLQRLEAQAATTGTPLE